jgi:hypothetical protein
MREYDYWSQHNIFRNGCMPDVSDQMFHLILYLPVPSMCSLKLSKYIVGQYSLLKFYFDYQTSLLDYSALACL